MLSNTCKYGIRGVIYLAVNGAAEKKIGLKQVSKELDLPGPFLGKVLQSLVKSKILNSVKGPNGGFSLAKPADEITLFDIIETIDGTAVFDECLIGVKICEVNPEYEKKCPFNTKSHKVRCDLKKLFQNQTIGDFAEGVISSDVILKI